MEEVKKYLLDYGYSAKSINKILNTYPLYNSSEKILLKSIKDVIDVLFNLGYTKNDIIGMTTLAPELFDLIPTDINQKIKDLVALGYTKSEAIKIIKSCPKIFSLSIDNIEQKINDMIALGYTKIEVIKMTKSFTTLFGLGIDNIKQKIEDIISLGYSRLEVIKMTKSCPSLFVYSIDNIKQKINDIIALGYSESEVIKMINIFPTLLSLSIDNITPKIEFYKSINIHCVLINSAIYLMQSIELSYARYMFYKSKGIEISTENYKKLFINQKRFEKAYGISKKELLEMYDYNEFIKEKNNGRTIQFRFK